MNVREKNNPFSPICLRVSPEEKAKLEHDAGNVTLSAYIREKVLGENAEARKRRMTHPIKDHKIIAQFFALIKQTQSWNNLNQIAKAINSILGWLLQNPKKHYEMPVKPLSKYVPF